MLEIQRVRNVLTRVAVSFLVYTQIEGHVPECTVAEQGP